jgi:hypothetical protein
MGIKKLDVIPALRAAAQRSGRDDTDVDTAKHR